MLENPPIINVNRNEAFPIHVDFTDDKADFNKMKPGGIFVKKLYEPGFKVDLTSNEMPKATEESSDDDFD